MTYVRLAHGFVFFSAVIDWYNRKILSWEVYTTIDQEFCLSTYRKAANLYGAGATEILDSDQEFQYTSKDLRTLVVESGAQFSMDGEGRTLDNNTIERFWRTLKFRRIHLEEYQSIQGAKNGIYSYMKRYNSFRPHTAHRINTPDEVYSDAA